MSAEKNTTYDEGYFEQLEALCSEPVARRIFQQIRGWNQLLLEEPISEQEVQELMETIDEEWSSFMKLTANISGRVTFPNVNSSGQYETRYYENEQMVFGGVVPHVYEDNAEHRHKAIYQLKILLFREAILDDGAVKNLKGFASVDEIADLSFEDSLSLERARSILEHYCPELLDDIDEVFFADREDESHVLADLAQLSYDPRGLEEDVASLVTLALDVYSSATYSFDEHIPYAMTASGFMWMKDAIDGKFEAYEMSASGLVQINHIKWNAYPVEPHQDLIVPCVTIDFLLSDLNATISALVPATSVINTDSIRLNFYKELS